MSADELIIKIIVDDKEINEFAITKPSDKYHIIWDDHRSAIVINSIAKVQSNGLANEQYVTLDDFRKIKIKGSKKELVVVTVSIKNKSLKRVRYSKEHFLLEDGDGKITSPSWSLEALEILQKIDELGSGYLAPNGSVTGQICFDIKKGMVDLRLIFTSGVEECSFGLIKN